MDTRNLKLRHNTYFARLVVPARLRDIVGKRELTQTLQTGDLKIAQKRRFAALATMQGTIDKAARGATTRQPTVPQSNMLLTALSLRDEVRAGRMDRGNADDALAAAVERELDAYERSHGVDADGGPVVPEAAVVDIRLAHSVVEGGTVTLLSEEIATYLSEAQARITAGTRSEKMRNIGDFQTWLKRDIEVTAVTRAHARTYMSEVLMKRGAAAATIRKVVFTLSALWNWMELRGTVTANVWIKLSGAVKESKRGVAPVRRPWNDDELSALLTKLKPGDVLVPLTVLGAMTGMRVEELASLKLADVLTDAIHVREGKNENAVRYVPLVPTVRPLVAALVKGSTDGYLLSGLLSGGVDGRRSHLITKRFGLTIRRLGFADEALVFHSLRGSFAQKLERAGVAVSTAQLIIGHERDGMTYGLYSKGVDTDALQEAVSKVSYGAAVDTFARNLANTFVLKTRSRRRFRRAA